jgi:hypothetical protein
MCRELLGGDKDVVVSMVMQWGACFSGNNSGRLGDVVIMLKVILHVFIFTPCFNLMCMGDM